MARIPVTTYTYLDDLTGAEVPTEKDLEAVSIVIDGKAVVLDLSRENARHLRKQLGPYMRAGRQANLSQLKQDLRAGKPDWADKPELLGEDPKPEPKPEAPKPPPVDPPKPAPVMESKPEPKPATEPAPKSLPQLVDEAKQEAGDRAVTATRPAGATAVPQPTRSPEDETDWAQWAPSSKDNQRKRGEKRRAWCKAKGYVFGERGKLPEAYNGQYDAFYRNTANWAPIPDREDLLTNTSRALADAAQRVR